MHKEKSLKTIGKPVVPYRKVLDNIFYILRTVGYQWKLLFKKFGSSSVCHIRFQVWSSAGMFNDLD